VGAPRRRRRKRGEGEEEREEERELPLVRALGGRDVHALGGRVVKKKCTYHSTCISR